jgi:hypothetical protein
MSDHQTRHAEVVEHLRRHTEARAAVAAVEASRVLDGDGDPSDTEPGETGR